MRGKEGTWASGTTFHFLVYNCGRGTSGENSRASADYRKDALTIVGPNNIIIVHFFNVRGLLENE
jgi:hypothetical protein